MPEDPTKSVARGAIEAIYKPIEDIVKILAGPAAEEIGLSFRDSIQVWRFKRQVRLFERVKTICDGAGIKPEAVKLPLLFEIVEKASLEEDDDLQDRWANLLANAANPNHNVFVLPAWPDILKQISKLEAVFLDDIYIWTKEGRPNLTLAECSLRLPPICADNLKRLGLITQRRMGDFPSRISSDSTKTLRIVLTDFGFEFVKACKSPKDDNPSDM
ncbi:MAG: DUF4393 domain-containing protein [Acidobacteriia bacterium]|nr:DUF4393 domain-containing protein [Terriglobia bacterium]